MPLSIFISHSSQDREFVEKELLATLRDCGFSPWYSPESIQSAEEWERRIRGGLRDSDAFLVVLSGKSVLSEWVRTEVAWAFSNRKGKILPILLETCDPTDLHLMLIQLQHVDYRRNSAEARKKLVDALRSQARGVVPPTSAPPEDFVPPEEASILVNIGMAHLRRQNPGGAERHFLEATEVAPMYAGAFTLLGIAQLGQGKVDQAITAFDQALALRPVIKQQALILMKRGVCFGRKEEYRKALADLDASIKLDDSSALAYEVRATLRMMNAMSAEALADANEALSIDPNYVKALITRAGILRIRGQFDEAQKDYIKARKIDPSSTQDLPDHLNNQDQGQAAAMDEAMRSVAVLRPLTEIDKLTPQGKMRAFMDVHERGFERIIADLDFLLRMLPANDPKREGFALLKELAGKAFGR